MGLEWSERMKGKYLWNSSLVAATAKAQNFLRNRKTTKKKFHGFSFHHSHTARRRHCHSLCVLMSCQQNVYNNVKSSLNCLNYANRSTIACNMQTNNSPSRFHFHSFFLRFGVFSSSLCVTIDSKTFLAFLLRWQVFVAVLFAFCL